MIVFYILLKVLLAIFLVICLLVLICLLIVCWAVGVSPIEAADEYDRELIDNGYDVINSDEI